MKTATLIGIGEDSCNSENYRSAAWCLVRTKYKNGRLNKQAAISLMSDIVPENEAIEYIEMVINEAANLEWGAKL